LSKEGTVAITSVTSSEASGWLTLTGPGTADGLGTYTATVDRTGLASGPYAATISFEADTGARVNVAVSMRVGAGSGAIGDTGHLWVLLLDGSNKFVDQVDLDAIDGEYAYRFDGVTAGQYFLIAGSDSDNDLLVCDAGESCGAYPTLGVSTPVDVNSNVSSLDFITTFGSTLAQSAQSGNAQPVGVARPAQAQAGRKIPSPDKR